MKKLVIFDLDGTLLNTIADLTDSVNYVLTKYGFPIHEEETYKMFIGNGAGKLIERSLPKNVSEETYQAVKKDFIARYTGNAAIKTIPYNGITALLKLLSGKGIMLAVASNKPHRETEKATARYFPDIQFEMVLGHREGHLPKPDPQIVYDILNQVKVSKEEVIYAGDSSVDMQTAKTAGIFSAGCSWGFRTREELLAGGADIIIDSPVELIPYVIK